RSTLAGMCKLGSTADLSRKRTSLQPSRQQRLIARKARGTKVARLPADNCFLTCEILNPCNALGGSDEDQAIRRPDCRAAEGMAGKDGRRHRLAGFGQEQAAARQGPGCRSWSSLEGWHTPAFASEGRRYRSLHRLGW